MRSPFNVCIHTLSSLTSVDKLTLLKNLTDVLNGIAPLGTVLVIFLLTYFTYEHLIPSWITTFTLYFFMTELFGNWALFYTTNCFIEKNAGNSELSAGLSHVECRQLRYCPTCKIYKPERSHHCTLCNRCVNQRDHHCFFLGSCVGGDNLCYFIYFCFYAALGCLYSALTLHKFYSSKYERNFLSSQFHYYFYPVTLVHWVGGKAVLAEVGWVTLLYVAWATLAFCSFCVIQQLFYVLRGQTAYEYNKGLLTVHRSAFNNFTHVFGRFWLLRLLIPFPHRKTPTDPRSFTKII